MIVWGGEGCGRILAPCSNGGLYDPSRDVWEPLEAPAPIKPRGEHTAIWAGDRMIVFGGWTLPRSSQSGVHGDGASYDPSSKQWTMLPSTGAPSPRVGHTAVWTGTQMIVWGGDDGTSHGDGAIYDVATSRWLPMARDGAPTPRHDHTAVWTGSEMIVWAGFGCGDGSTNCEAGGGAYRPATDTWRPLRKYPCPGRAAFVDGRMLVWGGFDPAGGGIYDPDADAWVPMATEGQPRLRGGARVLPVDHGVLVWGGAIDEETFYDGGKFLLPH
ncbi:MAG: kelch repeat protein [Labilithrix sp.]|nr:kelch repeat protein [Labilithrix sp.]